MSKRGSRCPDCGGPHGRGYHLCPKPYANYLVEPSQVVLPEPPDVNALIRKAIEQFDICKDHDFDMVISWELSEAMDALRQVLP